MPELLPLVYIPVELIDTCWDVNINIYIQKLTRRIELIDTCWDVNL